MLPPCHMRVNYCASSVWLCWDVTKTLPVLYLSAPGRPRKQVSEKQLSLLLQQPETGASRPGRDSVCPTSILHIRVRKPGPQPSSQPVLAGGTTPGEGVLGTDTCGLRGLWLGKTQFSFPTPPLATSLCNLRPETTLSELVSVLSCSGGVVNLLYQTTEGRALGTWQWVRSKNLVRAGLSLFPVWENLVYLSVCLFLVSLVL